MSLAAFLATSSEGKADDGSYDLGDLGHDIQLSGLLTKDVAVREARETVGKAVGNVDQVFKLHEAYSQGTDATAKELTKFGSKLILGALVVETGGLAAPIAVVIDKGVDMAVDHAWTQYIELPRQRAKFNAEYNERMAQIDRRRDQRGADAAAQWAQMFPDSPKVSANVMGVGGFQVLDMKNQPNKQLKNGSLSTVFGGSGTDQVVPNSAAAAGSSKWRFESESHGWPEQCVVSLPAKEWNDALLPFLDFDAEDSKCQAAKKEVATPERLSVSIICKASMGGNTALFIGSYDVAKINETEFDGVFRMRTRTPTQDTGMSDGESFKILKCDQ